MIDDNEEFVKNLYKILSHKMTMLSNDSHYYSNLPSDIQYISSEETVFNYGHPISWELFGKMGIHGFIIGVLTKDSHVSDDMSENNYYPPIVTQTLSSISPEYSYSQIAIVLVLGDIESTVDTWLKDWKDDNRYFRKILLYIPTAMDINTISEKIIGSCFTPWRSIKLIKEDKETANVFEEEEE